MLLSFLFFILIHLIVHAYESKCSYKEKCSQGYTEMVNIHVIPHTHDDAGWLKTVDEYYLGNKKYIDRAGVLYIIDSIIGMLDLDALRKFSYVEGAFIYRWLLDHNHNDTQKLAKFVENGQLEILSGGWVMNDEACTHYSDIIQQMSLGFKMFQEAFGECAIPRTGWQIDPFGHSAAFANLLAGMGFDGLFYGRVSDKVKASRESGHGLEFLWRTLPDFSQVYGDRTTPPYDNYPDGYEYGAPTNDHDDMFVSILPNLYQAPAGFCFDIFCGDEPIQDNPEANGYNVDERVLTFLVAMERQSRNYDTNHIVITMGSDFHYQSASSWYNNLDKLIKHVNLKRSLNETSTKFNMFYSTPGCYLYALNKAKGTAAPPPLSYNDVTLSSRQITAGPKFARGWPQVKGGDFFPLINIGNQAWTGYFTSRPTLKGLVRDSSRFLHICKQIQVLADVEGVNEGRQFLKLEMALALSQHHDAVSGTAKQYVTNDYVARLSAGYPECQEIIERGLKILGALGNDSNLTFCPLLNISRCQFSQENDEFDVLIYNPLAWAVRTFATVPVKSVNLIVTDSHDGVVPSQIDKVPRSISRIPERGYKVEINGSSDVDACLVFAVNLPALGTGRYQVRSAGNIPEFKSPPPFPRISKNDIKAKKARRDDPDLQPANADDLFIENEYLRLEFDSLTKSPSRLINKERGLIVTLRQSFGYYGSRNSFAGSSGAYLFRADAYNPTLLPTEPVELSMLKGPVMQQARQKVSPWIDQEYTLYDGSRDVEITWTVGPIPMDGNVPKDVVTIFETDICSAKLDRVNHFYTDSNARFMVPRTLSLNSSATEATNFVGEHYYPINSKIYIKDEMKRNGEQAARQLGLVVDRAQGGSSILNGSLEIMLHRRLLYDDALGVGERLDEIGLDGQGLIARGRHWLVFDEPTQCDEIMTQLAQIKYLQPEIMFTPASTSNNPPPSLNYQAPQLNKDFPPNLHLLTLARWDRGILIRLEHIYSPGEHPTLSKPVSIELTTLFSSIKFDKCLEMTLGGNQKLSDLRRFKWPLQYQDILSYNPDTPFNLLENTTFVTLRPLDIKTYYLGKQTNQAA